MLKLYRTLRHDLPSDGASPDRTPTALPPPYPAPQAADRLPSPKVDPNSVIYTDASLSQGRLGCGAFDPQCDPERQDHCFQAPTGTILYGELLAILFALTLRSIALPIHILTDSLMAITLITRALDSSDDLPQDCAQVLHSIVTHMRERAAAGAPTTVGKVRGHLHNRGNTRADKNARGGTKDDAPPTPRALADATSPTTLLPSIVPRSPVPLPAAPEEGDPADAVDSLGGDRPHTSIPEPFTSGVRKRCHTWLQLQFARLPPKTNLASNLQRLFGDPNPRTAVALGPSMHVLDPKAKGLSSYARKTILQTRYRCIYYTRGQAGCPLCHLPDHSTHLFGQCKHPVINGLIIRKHNDGAQLVLKAFRNRCPEGNAAIIANVGRGDAAPHRPTVPAWLGLDPAMSALCPDILIVKGWPQDKLDAGQHPNPGTSGVSLLFFEYKTCNDYDFDSTNQRIWDKYTPTPDSPRPHRQHLFEMLRAKGWQVLGLQPDGLVSTSPTADRMLTIAIGHGAFIRTDTTITSFTAALGLPSSAANRLAKTLVIHQATAAAKIRLTANNLRCNPPTARSG